MENNYTIMQGIRDAAAVLKKGRLKEINEAASSLSFIREKLGFESEDEAMVFVAIFDRQCGNRKSDLEDISDYFECSSLDVMQYVPAINNLVKKGYLTVENRNEALLTNKNFLVCPDIFYAIIEGRDVEPVEITENIEYDQFDFCEAVGKLVEDRSEYRIETKKLFICVQKLEDEYAKLPLVENLKGVINDVEDRTLFYEMCKDFASAANTSKRLPESDFNDTVNDIYDRIKNRAAVKGAIVNSTHPLVKAELICLSREDEIKLTRKGIVLLYGENSNAVLPSNKAENRYEFVNLVYNFIIDTPRRRGFKAQHEFYMNMNQIEEENIGLSMVAKTRTHLSEDVKARIIFYLTAREMIDGDTYSISDISDFCEKRESVQIMSSLKRGAHPLVKTGIVEVTGGGYYEGAQLQLTDKGKEIFLEEDLELFEEKVDDKDLIKPEKIYEKQLFFESSLEKQLSILRESLEEENYQKLCKRLGENKLPNGVSILFYGKPGTGKTETALQIAKATGRAIMHVDISATKTCWFGESEKLIKAVFTKYRHLCKKSQIKPILLFNEADAVFSKRKDSTSSNVAQTENAIQNIILEEMEKLDGILIATTNLADNLDHAFERRFLFKIKYENPSLEAKMNIWKDKLPLLKDDEARKLASEYDFSGGQIDNIVRKSLMEEVVKGKKPNLSSLMEMCDNEKIGGNEKTKIGF
ncbi:MAG: AAA family ATPase [Bacteroidales bacterium]|nr:AAA family ATPase [Bacteroidales bacterium]